MTPEARSTGGEGRRRHWLATLALAEEQELENYWQSLPDRPGYEHLRKPEAGLVMVRARAGNTGVRFNLGEMSVTRCTVRLDSGVVGFGYVAGRRFRHAELVALFDALLQHPGQLPPLARDLLDPLEKAQRERKKERQDVTAATRVDFFTMVRGED